MALGYADSVLLCVIPSGCHDVLIIGCCRLALSEYHGAPLVLSLHKCLGNVGGTMTLVLYNSQLSVS